MVINFSIAGERCSGIIICIYSISDLMIKDKSKEENMLEMILGER